MDPTDTVTFHLAEDEVKVYNILCREADEHPKKYRSSRKVECPLFHIVDLLIGFIRYGTRYSDTSRPDRMIDDAQAVIRTAHSLLEKAIDAPESRAKVEYLNMLFSEDPRAEAARDPSENEVWGSLGDLPDQ